MQVSLCVHRTISDIANCCWYRMEKSRTMNGSAGIIIFFIVTWHNKKCPINNTKRPDNASETLCFKLLALKQLNCHLK